MKMRHIATPDPTVSPAAVTDEGWRWLADFQGWLLEVWEWVNDYGAAIAAVATVLAVVVAIWSLASAAKDNRARSRPIVIAEFRRARRNDRAIDFIVRNVGPSLASKLEVTFEPSLSPQPIPNTTAHLIARRYALPNLVLGPNQEFRNLWWSSRPGPGGKVINSEPTPTEFTVSISYKGTRWRRYRDEFKMNISTIKYETESISSASPERQLKEGVAQLGKVVKGLTAIKIALQAHDGNDEPDFLDAMASMGIIDPPLSVEDANPEDGQESVSREASSSSGAADPTGE